MEKWKKYFFQLGKIFFQVEHFFFQPGKFFFPIFPGATLQKNNEISNKSNLLGLRKDRKKLENVLYQLHNKILGKFIIKNVLGVSTGQ